MSDGKPEDERPRLTEEDKAIIDDIFARLEIGAESKAELLTACRFWTRRTEELEDQGMSKREAARQAARESGNVHLVQMICHGFN